MGLRELLEHEAGLAPSAEREPTSALEYLQDVYTGRRVSDPARVRAAALALPFESPKLAVVAVGTGDRFSEMLERAIARSRAGPPIKEVMQIELKAEPA